ncbi:phosphatidylinositol-specific phospholipase C domain-containing protein [Paenibacillus pedocola]|uniref:phosphatidylinositol-specific phospholipase C domain-containing protein n=1 Tax=Paenibacillus pedocola TaxID=3242193 RepID=UPI002877ADE6|nr:phosphatidylinositol-specific phospholipase C domain-containing protein [Paenibacillus typhae]
MDYKNWMYVTTGIHNRKLRNICLPASHDSGTYNLSHTLTPDPNPELKKALDIVQKIAKDMDKIPGIGKIINPFAWVQDAIVPAIKGVSTATTRSIGQQLSDGIRSLDLRVYYNAGDKQFYTYHGLMGTRITDILNDILTFLKSTSGEIVFVTMGHFKCFEDKQYTDFSNLVKQTLGDYAYTRKNDLSNRIMNDPFDNTYTEIINQSGSAKSRVILVNDKSEDPVFWPKTYSPPDNNKNNNTLYGYYTDTNKLDYMLNEQYSNFQNANRDKPFALYMTLTPNESDVTHIIISSLASAIAKLAAGLLLNPITFSVGTALEGVAAGLAIYNATLDWKTLKKLSWKVDSDIEKLMVNHFLASFQGNNPISFIYLDYYETTDIVHFAINLSLNKYYKWYGNERISAVSGISPESNLSPALASYNTQMHMVFKGAHSNDLCQAVFNGSQWTGNVKISSISGISPESGLSPALAVFGDKLYMVFKGAHSNDLCQAVFDGSQWTGNVKISSISGISPNSNVSPALVTFRDKLYMVFKGAHSNDLCQAVFDGNQWAGNVKISSISRITPESTCTPALAVFGDKLYMVYKGAHSNDLCQAIFDGSEWTGNVSISSISDISPQSDSSPALTAFSDNLYLVYKGANSSDTYQAVFDGSGWMGDVKLSDISDISPASDHRPSLSALDEKLFMVYKGSGSNDIYESIMEAIKFG